MRFAGDRRISVPCDRLDLYGFGDQHFGAAACAEDKATDTVVQIADSDHAFVILMGDTIEAIAPGDKRFDATNLHPSMTAQDLASLGHWQFKRAVDIMRPLAERRRCLGALMGNHDRKLLLGTGNLGLYGWFCREMDCEPLSYSCTFDLKVWFNDPKKLKRGKPDRTVRIAAHHGAGAAGTLGGKINKAIGWARGRQDAEIVFWGHSHLALVVPRVMMTADPTCRRARDFRQLLIMTGSYLKSDKEDVTTYGEMWALEPVALETPWASIIHGRKRIVGCVG